MTASSPSWGWWACGRESSRSEGVSSVAGTSPRRVTLDSDELAAVSAFVRAGLVDPDEADQARAQVTGSARFAAG